jgi:hypothetical protein
MEKQEATLQGDNYSGMFSASQEQEELWAGSGYTESLEDNYRWYGVGIIKHLQTGESHRFLLSTGWNPYGKEKGLVEYLVRIEGEWPDMIPNTRIVNQKSVYDLLLGQMYEDAREGEKNEIIPTVFPKPFSYEALLDRGLVTDESGQIMIPMNA